MKLKVSEAVIACLELEGVDTVFGHPGGAVLPIYEALRTSNIQHVLVKNEQSSAHMANGYGRAKDSVGVCLATSGPGATNLITGIATAYMDSIPLIAITGQVNSKKIGTDLFQEADVIGSTEPFTKNNYLIKNKNDIPRVFKEAFHIANTGRKGPVLIDIPRDIQDEIIDFEYPETVEIRGYKPTLSGHSRQIAKAVKKINEATQPIICVGGGIGSANCREELYDFVMKTKIPVVCTLMGVDSFPNDSEYFAGLLGSHGYPFVNDAMNKADLIIVIGARFTDRSTAVISGKNTHQHIVHIDIDPAEIGKNIKTQTPIVGDARLILEELSQNDYSLDIKKWTDNIKYSRKTYMEETLSKVWPLEGTNPFRLIKAVSDYSTGKSLLTSDVGQNQIWASHYYIANQERRYLTSGGLAPMGYSLPAAIGARFALRDDTKVTSVMGEGGFQMLMGELALVKEYNLDIKVIILNNNRLGMVRELQLHAYNKNSFHGVDIAFNPDFMKLAEAYGIKGYQIRNDDDISDVLSQAYASDEPCFIECIVHPDFPTMPNGRWE
ncbi:MAG: biosynthetic-type acetolactate synthase large subunit [Tissierellales bacterium]|nr:biosynthetic-type acetolactate synthase large subunit [Tissierellales bacterium]MBN2826953.1 biosynthetic-type acetolactate synthase large subunit [Tissierellales bacterium]